MTLPKDEDAPSNFPLTPGPAERKTRLGDSHGESLRPFFVCQQFLQEKNELVLRDERPGRHCGCLQQPRRPVGTLFL